MITQLIAGELLVSVEIEAARTQTYIHCHNCPVMTDATEAFFNRTPPERYLDEWQQVLEATPKAPKQVAGVF